MDCTSSRCWGVSQGKQLSEGNAYETRGYCQFPLCRWEVPRKDCFPFFIGLDVVIRILKVPTISCNLHILTQEVVALIKYIHSCTHTHCLESLAIIYCWGSLHYSPVVFNIRSITCIILSYLHMWHPNSSKLAVLPSLWTFWENRDIGVFTHSACSQPFTHKHVFHIIFLFLCKKKRLKIISII